MRGRRLLSVLLAGTLALGTVMPVRADSIEERQQKANELESQKSQAQEDANQLSEQLNTVLSEMQQTQSDIETKQDEIVEKEDELMYAQIDANNQYESMKKRIKYMYENTQFIEILFESKSIGDFLNNAEYITQISEYDRDMLTRFQEIVESIRQQQAVLEQERVELEDLQNQLIEKQNSVSAMLQDKNIEISSLEAQIGENARILQELEQAAAEAARKQQEAAAAAEAAKNSGSSSNGSGSSSSASGVSTGKGESYTPSAGSGVLSNPCPSAYISSEFGGRSSPGGIGSTNHKGRDYAAASGSPIYAAASGTVTTVGYNSARGNYLVINHGDGLATLYQHCSAIYVAQGQSVSQGENIAAVGSTGASTGPHLHFEVHVNGVPVDPRNYL